MVSVFTPQSRGGHPGRGPLSAFTWHRVLSFARFLRRAAPGNAGWMPDATSCGRNWPFALIFSREMLPSAGAPGAASRRGWLVLTTSGGPDDGGATSRGAPFRTETGTFLFWAVHWGMSDRYIVGFARLVYCYYCLTDLSKLFCDTYNIDICMTIWHLLLTVFCPGKVKMMYQQHDVLMETVKMHCQKMYMMWNKVLWKKKNIWMYDVYLVELQMKCYQVFDLHLGFQCIYNWMQSFQRYYFQAVKEHLWLVP